MGNQLSLMLCFGKQSEIMVSKDDLVNELKTCNRNVRGMRQHTHFMRSPNQVWSEGLHLTMRHHCLAVHKRALSVYF